MSDDKPVIGHVSHGPAQPSAKALDDAKIVPRWNETVRHRSGYPYPDNDGQTHFEGCWRHPRHHNCAVARAERIRVALETVRDLAARDDVSDSWIVNHIHKTLMTALREF